MSETKKRAWERLYEQYQNGEIDEEFNKLKEKMENHKLGREEYKEYEKMTKIKGNISKVKNILELRGKLQKDIEEIKKEKEIRENLAELSQKNKELEDALNKNLEEQSEKEIKIKELGEKLKDKELLPEEREKIEEDLKKTEKEKSGLRIEANNNNIEFGENNQKLKESNKNNKKYKRKTTEDLKDLITNKKIKVSKCNVACSNLMKGASWESIELKLDQVDERYTGKKEDLKRLEKASETKVTEEELETQKQTTTGEVAEDQEHIVNPAEEQIDNTEKNDEHDEEESDVKPGRFRKIMSALRHPIRTFKEWRENKIMPLPEPEEEKVEEKPLEEIQEKKVEEKPQEEIQEKKVEEKPKSVKNNDFKAYLKEVAEKGMEAADKDRLNAEKQKYRKMEREAGKDNDGTER